LPPDRRGVKVASPVMNPSGRPPVVAAVPVRADVVVPARRGVSVDVDVIVEIPKGSRNKYEFDQRLGRIRLDRMLFTSTVYPGDYGFVPDTLAEDGDPIDALVLLDEPTFPGCLVRARVIAVFWMRDEQGPDAKLLCVPADDPRHAHLQELDDVPMYEIAEIWHFFDIYKRLEPGKSTETRGWERRKEATRALEEARRRFAEQPAAATA
jgi:inorganic pyrophosphatase